MTPRLAAFNGDLLLGCLFIGPSSTTLRWDAMKALFEEPTVSETQRRAMLSGKSIADPGPVICACFGVGMNVIRAALQRAKDAENPEMALSECKSREGMCGRRGYEATTAAALLESTQTPDS